MKKYLVLALTVLSLNAALPAWAITLRVNGQAVKSDVQPQMIDDRVMIPARALAEALGANAFWDNDNEIVDVSWNVRMKNLFDLGDKMHKDAKLADAVSKAVKDYYALQAPPVSVKPKQEPPVVTTTDTAYRNSLSSSKTDFTKQPIVQAKPKEIIETMEQFKSSTKSLSYDELARKGEFHVGERIHYIGNVLQVMEVPSSIRIDIGPINQYGTISDSQVVYVSRIDTAGRLLDKDRVEVWGTVKGIMTYTAVMGQAVTVPAIECKYLTIVK